MLHAVAVSDVRGLEVRGGSSEKTLLLVLVIAAAVAAAAGLVYAAVSAATRRLTGDRWGLGARWRGFRLS